jgi:hypothetical protein
MRELSRCVEVGGYRFVLHSSLLLLLGRLVMCTIRIVFVVLTFLQELHFVKGKIRHFHMSACRVHIPVGGIAELTSFGPCRQLRGSSAMVEETCTSSWNKLRTRLAQSQCEVRVVVLTVSRWPLGPPLSWKLWTRPAVRLPSPLRWDFRRVTFVARPWSSSLFLRFFF